jgi:hypothetical protein
MASPPLPYRTAATNAAILAANAATNAALMMIAAAIAAHHVTRREATRGGSAVQSSHAPRGSRAEAQKSTADRRAASVREMLSVALLRVLVASF